MRQVALDKWCHPMYAEYIYIYIYRKPSLTSLISFKLFRASLVSASLVNSSYIYIYIFDDTRRSLLMQAQA